MRGISRRQGRHQLAQKSTSTTLPRRSDSETVPPASASRVKSGASLPTDGRLAAHPAPAASSSDRHSAKPIHPAAASSFLPYDVNNFTSVIYCRTRFSASRLCPFPLAKSLVVDLS